ncbi:C40 family peptidase [Glycomyces arizonensis]|uniref:C40 family peptidase n=1 Tax=Glycomyces arizonensis TaxID=256035 RepID=UPI00040F0B95|nr:C40 family peptidase [Glycomyces arizonensis]
MRTRRLAAAFAAAVLLPASAAVLTASEATAEPTPEEVESDIEERNAELELVIEDYNAKQEELEDAEDLIGEIEAQLPELQAAVDASNEAVAQIAAAAHTGGEFAMVNSILAGDPEDFTDRLMMLQNISDAENAQLQAHLDEVDELETRQAELEALQSDADAILNDLEEQQNDIEDEIDELEVLLDQVTPDPPTYDNPDYNGDSAVVDFAYAQLGEPYSYGADGPGSWDCSGLVQGAWGNAGVSLSHNVEMQWNETVRISYEQLEPGDIVFYSGLGHDGIYIGDGQIIHAPHTGDVVRIADMDIMSIAGYGRP